MGSIFAKKYDANSIYSIFVANLLRSAEWQQQASATSYFAAETKWLLRQVRMLYGVSKLDSKLWYDNLLLYFCYHDLVC